MSRFDIADTPLGGLKVVQRRILTDERGSLCRLFCAEELEAAILKCLMERFQKKSPEQTR